MTVIFAKIVLFLLAEAAAVDSRVDSPAAVVAAVAAASVKLKQKALRQQGFFMFYGGRAAMNAKWI